MIYPNELKIDFEKIKPALLEAFIHVYGEHNSEIINNRMNKIIIDDYLSYKNIDSYYLRKKEIKKEELLIDVIKKTCPETKELEDRTFIENSDFIYEAFFNYPDVFEKISLLMPIFKFSKRAITKDDAISCLDYRITEVFDEKMYNSLTDYEKTKVDERRMEILSKLEIEVNYEEYKKHIEEEGIIYYKNKISNYFDIINNMDEQYDEFLHDNQNLIKYLEEYNVNEELSLQIAYEQNEKFIENLNLITETPDLKENIKKDVNFCFPGLIQNDDKIFDVSIVAFSRLDPVSYGKRDITFIHEIAHAIEMELLAIGNDYATFKSGFETTLHVEFKSKEEPEENRPFELMSETIHNNIAKEITDYLHQKGIFIFGESVLDNNPLIKKTCPYDDYYEIVEPFFDKYRQDILDARLSNEAFENFKEKIQEENLIELNELVAYAQDNLSGFSGIDKKSVEYEKLLDKSNKIVDSTNSTVHHK